MGCVQCKSSWGDANCDPCERCGYCPEECECKEENVTETKKIEENMKFKYNFCENKLWKLEGEYAYEISEDNHFHTQKGTYGSDGWILGENERIIFTFSYSALKVYYQKRTMAYQKSLPIPNYGEITVEFTENERINSS